MDAERWWLSMNIFSRYDVIGIVMTLPEDYWPAIFLILCNLSHAPMAVRFYSGYDVIYDAIASPYSRLRKQTTA